ncbi:MAG: serine O-acetyltransferase [Alphaproteobacteria bacterium]|nr:serine O-acetyltransferase [Alphaproteobacteria bacterium]
MEFFKSLIEDIDAMISRDPAARSRLEVFLTYPGFHVILFYRLAHFLWLKKFHLLGRYISYLGRWFTGIEIHPAAYIGRRLFIDHGMGVVIGETTQIGDDVTLYHGVTLGGIAPAINSKSQIQQKRHPTIADGVIIGAGAQILGPVYVGMHARIGANAVVLHDVPEKVTVTGIPAKNIEVGDTKNNFMAYGICSDEIQDPTLKLIENLSEEIALLKEQLNQIKR